MMQLYGARGWGSAIVEAMLVLAGQPYTFIDVAGFDRPGVARDRLMAVNPLAQTPALAMDDGEVLTETAAIALWLVERFPALAPEVGTPQHMRFLRLLVWLVANVYPTFTYGDYPERWAPTAPRELVASTDRHREQLYLWLEQQIVGPFTFGERPSVIDCYLAVMVSWRPREPWFVSYTPKLAMAASRTRRLEVLKPVMAANTLG
jgi:GST-like protein